MHPEPEEFSMKVLLKQVYGVHTTKVKCLEDEIDELKKNLLEATNKLKNYESECKRCIELEEAFKNCKAALLEQSKMFENLGQKISNFNQTESKSPDGKELEIFQRDVDVPGDNPIIHAAPVKKCDFSTNTKIHFLKNFMSSNIDENQDSLELSVPLQKTVCQDYSTLNHDSVILVPNTLEFGCGQQEKKKRLCDGNSDCATVCSDNPKEMFEIALLDSGKNAENRERVKKRLSDDDSIDSKLNKENEEKIFSGNKKMKTSVKETGNSNMLVTKLTNAPISPKAKNSKSSGDSLDHSKKISTPVLDKICNIEEDDFVAESKYEACKNSTSAFLEDGFFQTTVSPSLLPLKEKTNTKVIDNHSLGVEDLNDFQNPPSNKKAGNEEGNWRSCDKKKLAKKSSFPRPIKSTSRFKMRLDSLPPNFKKPTYRQTKLSKSIFQAKSTTAVNEQSDLECIEVDENFEGVTKDSVTDSPDIPTVSVSTKTVDFDATCIPDNYEYEIISSNNVLTKSKTGKDKVFPNSIMIVKDDTDSFDSDSSEVILEQKSLPSKKDKDKGSLNIKHIDVGELGNSFDRLPKKPEPAYKYKEETVRKQSERKQLNAFDCKECEKYYTDLGLTEEEKKQRMQKCSRHRGKFAPPPTPEHFWELEFPDTQECKARGYLNETQKVKLKTHRKRPL